MIKQTFRQHVFSTFLTFVLLGHHDHVRGKTNLHFATERHFEFMLGAIFKFKMAA